MEYIDTDEKLRKVAAEWRKEEVLGVDLECENNLHHYGTYLSIVQVSSKTHHWIVDILTIKDHSPLINMLKNKNIIKIFHDFSFDFRILEKELGVRPKNVFDTQIATIFLGRDKLGLGSLLEEFFGVKKQSKFQMADWTKRPINKDMLEYASMDSRYLIRLKSQLEKDLKKMGRLEWVLQECKALESMDLPWPEFTFMNVKGMKLLSPKERGIVKYLFRLREKLAKKVDRPSHFVMNNKRMLEIARNPLSLKQWQEMRGVHPIVRRTAKRWHEAVENGSKEKIEWPHNKIKRFKPKQRKLVEYLKVLREDLAEKEKLPRHLIMKDEQIRDIVIENNLSPLKEWQKDLVKDKVLFN